ncbi:hypothetical protein DFH06DRAFT_1338042 [Mycena polygramma]|nr:hypothetical protein DFH06DRAFT_1338042 [Mycena polygramma]
MCAGHGARGGAAYSMRGAWFVDKGCDSPDSRAARPRRVRALALLAAAPCCTRLISDAARPGRTSPTVARVACRTPRAALVPARRTPLVASQRANL